MIDIVPSATVVINSLAAEKKALGETVYNFAAGDPILPSHPKVIEAVTAAIQTEQILYPPIAGLPELREASANWMNQKYHCRYKVENTLVTVGGKFALFASLQVLLKVGDEVLIPSPYWVSYPQMALLFGARPIPLPTHEEDQWKLKPDTLKKHLTARAKVLILNSAGNPTGVLYSKEELKELLAIADAAGIFVISDEVYSEIVYDGNRFFSCGELSDKVLVIQSCSKNFAMTGWRVGFAFGPEPLIRSMTTIQSQSTTGASNVCQWGALAAFKNHDEITSQVRSAMQKRRDVFIDTFNRLFETDLRKPFAALYAFIPLSVFPEGVTKLLCPEKSMISRPFARGSQAVTITLTTPTPSGLAEEKGCKWPQKGDFNGRMSFAIPSPRKMDSSELCTELMAQYNIACVPGISFGKEGYLRMAFSEKEEVLREGLLALKKGMNR